MNSIIIAKGLNKKFFEGKKSLHVIKDIDLEIKTGEFVSIVGPSGAGKSTLLHILGGIDEPTSGMVLFDGKNLKHLSDKAKSALRNKRMGFVFQFYHLLNELNALENVMITRLINKNFQSSLKDCRIDAHKALKLVGLEKRLTHRPKELSGGEQQRVAIARALLNKPDIVFCDEPTGNLDSKTSEEVFGLLKEINKIDRTTFIIVTHNKDLSKVSDRILNIKDGVLI